MVNHDPTRVQYIFLLVDIPVEQIFDTILGIPYAIFIETNVDFFFQNLASVVQAVVLPEEDKLE
jgi:hypothetical protein